MVIDETLEVPIELILQSFFSVIRRDIIQHDCKIRSREVFLLYDSFIFLSKALWDEEQEPPY